MELPSGVRLCFTSCVGPRARSEVGEALRRAGYEVLGAHDPDQRIPSVIVFEAALAETADLIRAQSAQCVSGCWSSRLPASGSISRGGRDRPGRTHLRRAGRC